MKFIKKILFFSFISILIFGCKTNKSGWYEYFEDAKKVATKENKPILLFVHSIYDPAESKNAVKLITESPDFTKKLSDFVCVQFDFSDEFILRGQMPQNLTADEEKEFKNRQQKFSKQAKFADLYSVRTTPTILILTKEGYVVTRVDFDYASSLVDGYVSRILLEKDSVDEMNKKIAETKKGSSLKRIEAIDQFFESQDPLYRNILIDLFEPIPEMDKENKSGLVPKYLIEIAHAHAFEKLRNLDSQGASDVYLNAANDERLADSDKQTLYFYAAEALLKSRTPNLESGLEILNKAIDLAPDSDIAKEIKGYVTEIQKLQ